MGSSAAPVLYRPVRRIRGVRRHGPAGLAMKMTRQYLAGELSVLLTHLQAVANTEAAGVTRGPCGTRPRQNRSRHWAR